MIIISKIGLDLTLTCLSGISIIAEKLYSSITYIVTNDNEDILLTNFIKEIDLISTIKIIQKFINEIEINENTSQTINLCIAELHDILKEIETEFNNIETKITYNNSLYLLKNIRSCKFTNTIKRLATYKKILDNRIDLLLKILLKIN